MVTASGAIYLHNFLCLVTKCHPDTGEESCNPFLLECVCLLIPMYQVCVNVFVASLCPLTQVVSPCRRTWMAPAHFRVKQEALSKCSVLESCFPTWSKYQGNFLCFALQHMIYVSKLWSQCFPWWALFCNGGYWNGEVTKVTDQSFSPAALPVLLPWLLSIRH